MATKNLNVVEKAKSINYRKNGKPELETMSDTAKEFMFEKCREQFSEAIKLVKLPVSDHSKRVVSAFEKLMPELSDQTINLNDVDGEYKQLTDLLTTKYEGEYPTNVGIFLLICNQLTKSAGKLYGSITPVNRLLVNESIKEVYKAIKALQVPIRDKCITEWFEKATMDDLDDIRLMVKHREDPKDFGMPGNGMVPVRR